MKKFYIFLMFVLFLLNGANGQGSIPALSIVASAQSKHLEVNLQHRVLKSIENVHSRMGNKEWKICDIQTEKKSRVPFHYPMSDKGLLIKIYDSIYDWRWDTISIGWQFNNRTVNMVYNVRNDLVSETGQNWDGSIWENTYKYIYAYDANNNNINLLLQNWTISGWVDSWQYIMTYDTNNNQTKALEQGYFGTWVNTAQSMFTYDANNNMIREVTQIWNDSAWVDFRQETYTFDANNKLTIELWQNWNGTSWDNYIQYIYTYDTYNNQTSILVQDWVGSVWVNSYRYNSTYDVNNNMIGEIEQDWNGNAWVYAWQNIYTFDANNFAKSSTRKSWNSDSTKLTSGDSSYYYFHTVLGINDLLSKSNTLKIYPNPASTQVTIETFTIPDKSQLSIINLNGQEFIRKQITRLKTQLNITNLPGGVYFVRVTDARTVRTGKIVKQ